MVYLGYNIIQGASCEIRGTEMINDSRIMAQKYLGIYKELLGSGLKISGKRNEFN